MNFFTGIAIPFFTTIFKYLLLCIGAFSHVSNDGLVFISSSIQAEQIKPSNTWDFFVHSVGNTFYTTPNNMTSINHIKNEAVLWLNENSFMINMACIFTLIAGLTLIYFGFNFCKKNKTGISYHNYFIRIMLLSYYSLTNMSMIYLINTDGSPPFYLLSVVILFFNSFCLPIYCLMILIKNRNRLQNREVKENYGCIYLQYKSDASFFILVILLKQLMYSIVFIMSHFTYIHKVACLSIQGSVNLLFLTLIIYYNPFKKSLYFYQAVLITILKLATVTVSIIIFSISTDLDIILQILYGVIIFCNISVFLLPLLPWYKEKVRQYEEIQRNQSIDAFVDNSGLQEWVVREYLKANDD